MDDNAVAPWLARAEEYIRRSKAPNTLKAYQSDWRAFETFCRTHEIGYHRVITDTPVEAFVVAQLRGRILG